MEVTHLDGSVVACEGCSLDIIRFEAQFEIPASTIWDKGGIFTTHLWFFGWLAEQRVDGVETQPFEAWMETVDKVTVVSSKDTAEKTSEVPPTDPSGQPSL